MEDAGRGSGDTGVLGGPLGERAGDQIEPEGFCGEPRDAGQLDPNPSSRGLGEGRAAAAGPWAAGGEAAARAWTGKGLGSCQESPRPVAVESPESSGLGEGREQGMGGGRLS